MASGTSRGCDAIEPRQDVRADTVRECDIKGVRQAILRVTVEHHATCEACMQRLPEVVAPTAYALHWSEIGPQLARAPERDGDQRTFGAATPAEIVIAPVD